MAGKKSFRINKTLIFTLMVLPGALWFLLLQYLPMFGVVLAFKRFHFYRGGFLTSLLKSEWVGLSNFYYLFKTDAAWVITRNTILYNSAFIIFGTICSLALAIALSELLHKKLAKVYQTLMFCPYFLSWVVIGYLVFSFFNFDKGSVNSILTLFHIPPVNWYNEPGYWPYILVFVNLWKNAGYTSVIYLAAILSIERQYYEAAEIEGASKWQQTIHITIPHLKPLIVVLTLLAVGQIFRADFGLFYLVPRNSGALFPTTNVVDTYVFRGLMYTGNIGMTTAAGLYQSIVGLILVLTVNKTIKKFDKENAMF